MQPRAGMSRHEVQEFLHELERSGRRLRAASEKRYLKSGAEFYGVTVPRTREHARPVAVRFCDDGDLSGAIDFASRLWRTGVHEPRLAAVVIVSGCEEHFDDRIWKLGRAWLTDIDNWALCDGIGPNLLAPFVQCRRVRYKSKRREVLRWTRDPNLWVRRGALLSTIRVTRQDREWPFLFDVSERLLEDREYFVQKALGWMLRECAQFNPREVITFIQTHRDRMRRSTIRHAVSRLPKTLQQAARNG